MQSNIYRQQIYYFSQYKGNNNGRFSRGGRYCCLYKASKPNIKHIYYYALFAFVALLILTIYTNPKINIYQISFACPFRFLIQSKRL